jgi:hypothetical protein
MKPDVEVKPIIIHMKGLDHATNPSSLSPDIIPQLLRPGTLSLQVSVHGFNLKIFFPRSRDCFIDFLQTPLHHCLKSFQEQTDDWCFNIYIAVNLLTIYCHVLHVNSTFYRSKLKLTALHRQISAR